MLNMWAVRGMNTSTSDLKPLFSAASAANAGRTATSAAPEPVEIVRPPRAETVTMSPAAMIAGACPTAAWMHTASTNCRIDIIFRGGGQQKWTKNDLKIFFNLKLQILKLNHCRPL